MGKIKKILETELVGGTQSTDVYPVTSTKAVYDENNVRLDTILKPATEETAGLMSPEDKKNIDDKLSKSEGGEVNKHIVITNNNSNYSITINPNGNVCVWNKDYNRNFFNIRPLNNNSLDTVIDGNEHAGSIYIDDILSLFSKRGKIYHANDDTFIASKFKLRNGTNNQVLLGDGSTTSKLVSYISISPQFDAYIVNILNIDGAHSSFTILGATKELAGLMTATDKAKLDDIPNTYLPLSGGTLTGTLRLNDINSDGNGLDINNVNGIQSVDQDKVLTPEVWTTDGNSIPIDKAGGVPTLNQEGELDGYISSQDGSVYSTYDGNNGNTILNVTGNYDEEGSGGRIILKSTEDGKGKISIVLDGVGGSVNAETFKAINNQNKNEVWCTDGSRLNILNLLSNAAIYVAGGFELAESGIDNTTVVDSPDRIIYDETILGGRFLARKGMTCYTHWKADISKNIAPPSRYGIETDGGVFPFSNQMYKFSNYDNNIFIATCSDGKCTMKHLQ